jgi:class 3 adenylate cyclase
VKDPHCRRAGEVSDPVGFTAETGSVAATSPRATRILVVDDTAASARLLQGLLEIQGYLPIVAATGAEALDAVAREEPDLVLLDLLLPDLDGHEVCRRLREDPATRFLPVIVLTAAGDAERVKALEAGADDFLSKPIDHPELLARVRSLLRIKRYHDQIESQAADLEMLNKDLEQRVADQVTELSRLSRLRRFFPSSVADRIAGADEEWLLGTHRREVAVLYCELRGFTAFVQSAEPEEVMASLREFHLEAGECVRRHGATVGPISGDGFMVFLNDPVPCAAPALTAVLLAENLREESSRLLQRWRDDGNEFGVGQGIALGYATLGLLGVEDRLEYGPVGSVVHLASRLCEHATSGEILISQSVRTQLEEAHPCERLGPLTLRGFPAPVTAWRLGVGGAAGVDRLSSEAVGPLVPRIPEPPGPNVPAARAESAAPAAPAENAFVRQDEDWTLIYRGTGVRLRDSKGLGYIAVLMSRRGHEVHVFDLAGLSTANSVALRADGGPVIDEQAKEAYRRRLIDLEAERDEARDWGDLERASRVDEEMNFLTHELTTAFGLGGRPRKADNPSERIRKAVTNRIRQSLSKIESVHPELGRHLSNSIRTGTFCSYAPEDEIEWTV